MRRLKMKFLLPMFFLPVMLLSGLMLTSTCLAHTNGCSGQLSQAEYQICFTPGGHCDQAIVGLIRRAKKQIDLQAYSFNYWVVVNALAAAVRRGVTVNVIVDQSVVAPPGSKQVKFLLKHGVHVWKDSPPNGIAHNKVMIVDDRWLQTGSFNYTYAAQKKNVENVFIMKNSVVARCYDRQWHRRCRKAKDLTNGVYS